MHKKRCQLCATHPKCFATTPNLFFVTLNSGNIVCMPLTRFSVHRDSHVMGTRIPACQQALRSMPLSKMLLWATSIGVAFPLAFDALKQKSKNSAMPTCTCQAQCIWCSWRSYTHKGPKYITGVPLLFHTAMPCHSQRTDCVA